MFDVGGWTPVSLCFPQNVDTAAGLTKNMALEPIASRKEEHQKCRYAVGGLLSCQDSCSFVLFVSAAQGDLDSESAFVCSVLWRSPSDQTEVDAW